MKHRDTEKQKNSETSKFQSSLIDPSTMQTNDLTHAFIGAAIRSASQTWSRIAGISVSSCLDYELRKQGFEVKKEKPVPVIFDDVKLECGFRADLVVNRQIVVELKAKSAIHPVDKSQVLSHLRLLNLRYGLLINFLEEKLVDRVSRIVNRFEDV